MAATETVSIVLNGFGGEDLFEVDKNVQSKIKITINGGQGADKYNINGDAKIKIQDALADGNIMINKQKAKIYFK